MCVCVWCVLLSLRNLRSCQKCSGCKLLHCSTICSGGFRGLADWHHMCGTMLVYKSSTAKLVNAWLGACSLGHCLVASSLGSSSDAASPAIAAWANALMHWTQCLLCVLVLCVCHCCVCVSSAGVCECDCQCVSLLCVPLHICVQAITSCHAAEPAAWAPLMQLHMQLQQCSV